MMIAGYVSEAHKEETFFVTPTARKSLVEIFFFFSSLFFSVIYQGRLSDISCPTITLLAAIFVSMDDV